MSVKQPFNPKFGSTRDISAATSSASQTIDAQRGSKNVRFMNLSANVIFVRTWDSRNGATPAAAATDYPLAPNQTSVITKDEEHDVLSYLAETGASRMLVTLGEGW